MVPAEINKEAWAFVEDQTSWWARNLHIITQSGELLPLSAKVDQLQLLYWIGVQLAFGFPVRIQVLKYRRGGFTTASAALFFSLTHHLPYRKAFACAHDADGTDTIYGMIRIFQDYLPDGERKPLIRSNRKELAWAAPHASNFLVHTAGAKELARSKEIHYLHISERAFIPKPETSLLAVQQCVSDLPGTIQISESTANGATGDWYETWQANVRRRKADPDDFSGTLPLFFGWLSYPDYSRPLRKGQRLPEPDEEYELPLMQMGIKPAQRNWRLFTIAEKCLGDPEKFCQEYPATPDEAFRSSGRPAIPMSIIRHHEKLCREPIRRVILKRDNKGLVYAQDASPPTRQNICVWEIWNEPDDITNYTVAGDVAEGILSDPDDPRSETDFHAGAALNRRYLRYDATCICRMDPDLWGEELRRCAEWYNEAWASPEVNDLGMAALTAFKRPTVYQQLYRRRKMPDVIEEGRENQFLGWKTTSGNRNIIIDDWLAYTRPHPDRGFEGQIEAYSAALVKQERTFVVRKDGKREHNLREFDDLLFACMIALQLHLLCPAGSRRAPSARNDVAGGQKRMSAEHIGGFDTEDEDASDDEETG